MLQSGAVLRPAQVDDLLFCCFFRWPDVSKKSPGTITKGVKNDTIAWKIYLPTKSRFLGAVLRPAQVDVLLFSTDGGMYRKNHGTMTKAVKKKNDTIVEWRNVSEKSPETMTKGERHHRLKNFVYALKIMFLSGAVLRSAVDVL